MGDCAIVSFNGNKIRPRRRRRAAHERRRLRTADPLPRHPGSAAGTALRAHRDRLQLPDVEPAGRTRSGAARPPAGDGRAPARLAPPLSSRSGTRAGLARSWSPCHTASTRHPSSRPGATSSGCAPVWSATVCAAWTQRTYFFASETVEIDKVAEAEVPACYFSNPAPRSTNAEGGRGTVTTSCGSAGSWWPTRGLDVLLEGWAALPALAAASTGARRSRLPGGRAEVEQLVSSWGLGDCVTIRGSVTGDEKEQLMIPRQGLRPQQSMGRLQHGAPRSSWRGVRPVWSILRSMRPPTIPEQASHDTWRTYCRVHARARLGGGDPGALRRVARQPDGLTGTGSRAIPPH